jgi:hypothetical protein
MEYFLGYDTPCPGLVAAMQREKGWEDSTGRFEWIAEDGLNGWGDPAKYLKWTASQEKLVTTFYAISCGWPDRIWPRVTADLVDEEDVEVPVVFCSDAVGLSAMRSTCRCFYF